MNKSKASKKRIAIVYSKWYPDKVKILREAARSYLIENSILNSLIEEHEAAGSIEIPLLAQALATRTHNPCAALIALGVVIRGDTAHFKYVCRACSDGLMHVMLETGKPIGFGVLMEYSSEDAYYADVSPRLKDKATEAARAALSSLDQLDAINDG